MVDGDDGIRKSSRMILVVQDAIEIKEQFTIGMMVQILSFIMKPTKDGRKCKKMEIERTFYVRVLLD